ncbi:igLON family member 5-like isoform X1 [Scyliorhinus canicula]|uniref:igLON family member 5-like isoform X1 n=1 Tax=Scyliorhinus canicula TaxID=7830 RepID=UPI0018F529A0|nr:igLON family member 5-like isoform X1 [Scyliorhinus canicula]
MHRLCCLWCGIALTLTLQGLISEALDFFQSSDNITASQGQKVALSCYIDSNVTRVAWLNRSSILYAGRDKWSMDTRVSLGAHNELEYSIEISPVDVYDEGLYTCSYQTMDQPHTVQVYLIVQVPAQIVNISSDTTVNEGSNILLLCLAVGRPEPVITWKKVTSKHSYLINDGEYLEITAIKRQDAGDYECVTSNGLSNPDTRKVRITVNYAPVIKDVRNVTVRKGQPAVLRCEALSVPAADFQWYKEEKRLSGGIEGLRIQKDRTRSLLMFFNVSQESYGNYTCLASNKMGVSNASMLLHGGPPSHGVVVAVEIGLWLWLVASSCFVVFRNN